MIFFVLILLLLIFSSAEFSKHNEFNKDYISRDGTNYIKGIFVILILYSHGKGYIALDKTYLDAPYTAMQNHIGQMVVALFLFYSGYGIMEQIKKRRFDYIKTIPAKRFPNLLLNFDIAVCFYLILWLALGKTLTLKQIVFSLTAWDGVGNSSWYIFMTFALYIITFISFALIKFVKNEKADIVFIIILSVLSFHYTKIKDGFWYNTAFLYVLGFWYSYFKNIIEKVLMKNDMLYFSALAVILVAYIWAYLNKPKAFAIYEIWAALFTAITVMLTMKIKLGNNFLKWCGEHIFSIYILQRIPMIILTELGVAQRHKYIFLIVSYFITFAMAEIFDVATGKLSKLIWKPKKA